MIEVPFQWECQLDFKQLDKQNTGHVNEHKGCGGIGLNSAGDL